MSSPNDMQERAEEFRKVYAKIQAEIGKVIVGHTDIVHGVLTCLFVGGHTLLEGVPGLGKTLLVRTLSQVLDLDFNRIQFTPDLMPSDIMGTNIIMRKPGRAARILVSSRARSSPRSCWPTKSTGPRPKRSRLCWKPCRSTASPSAERFTSSKSHSS